MEILIAGPGVVVEVVVVDLWSGGIMVGHPLTRSQFRLMDPLLLIASWRSGGGDTPVGMLRFTWLLPPLGKVMFSRKFGAAVEEISSWKKTFLFSSGLLAGSAGSLTSWQLSPVHS